MDNELNTVDELIWKQNQIPFIIVHEINHALTCDENDMVLYFSTLLNTKYEYKANCGVAKLLIPFYMEDIDDVNQINVNDFMIMFDLPDKMYDICVCELKNYVNNNDDFKNCINI